MKQTVLYISFLIFTCAGIVIPLKGQEYVVNGGFEEGNFDTKREYSPDNSPDATGYYNPTMSTPDYIHLSQMSNDYRIFDGSGAAGIYAFDLPYTGGSEYREYIGGSLTEPLVEGENYIFSFYVSISDSWGSSISHLQAAFTSEKNKFDTEFVIPLQPLVEFDCKEVLSHETPWVRVQGKFTATGGEKFFILGNFRPNQHTKVQALNGREDDLDAVYFNIDNISLMPADSASKQRQDNIPESLSGPPSNEIERLAVCVGVRPTGGAQEYTVFLSSGNTKHPIKLYDETVQELAAKFIAEKLELEINWKCNEGISADFSVKEKRAIVKSLKKALKQNGARKVIVLTDKDNH